MYHNKLRQIIGLKTKTIVFIWNSVSQELGQDLAGWFSVPRSMGQGLHVASDRLGWEIPDFTHTSDTLVLRVASLVHMARLGFLTAWLSEGSWTSCRWLSGQHI